MNNQYEENSSFITPYLLIFDFITFFYTNNNDEFYLLCKDSGEMEKLNKLKITLRLRNNKIFR